MTPNLPALKYVKRMRRDFNRLGSFATAQDLALRSLNQFCFFRILKGLKIEKVNPQFLECDEKYSGMFMSQSMLKELVELPEYELSENFLNHALSNGHKCYGLFYRNVLAAYSWYSNKPTPINPADLILHFDDAYVYMYKGFTHPNYRGQRLYATGMTRALQAYLERGCKGMLCYVESNNFTSLRSCYRMGYTDFGNLYVARLFNRYLIHSDPECEHYGFALEWARSLPEAKLSQGMSA
jgi:GNAT superfamily N-acetyltransferase